MSSASPLAEFKSLTLSRTGAGQASVRAEGQLGPLLVALGVGPADPAGPPALPTALIAQLKSELAAAPTLPGTPGAAGSAGTAESPTLARITSVVARLEDSLGDADAVWLTLGSAAGHDAAHWVAAWTPDHVDLLGIQHLSGLPLQLPGLTGRGNAWLFIGLRLRGQGDRLNAEATDVLLTAGVEATSTCGIGLLNYARATGQLTLALTVGRLPAVADLLDRPALLLEAASQGELQLLLQGAAGGDLLGLPVDGGHRTNLFGKGHSPAGSTSFTLDQIRVQDSLDIRGGLPAGLATLHLDLDASFENVRLDRADASDITLALQGTARLDLNLAATPACPSGFRGALDAEVHIHHDPDGEDRLAFSLASQSAGSVRPRPGDLRVDLPTGDLLLTLRRPASDTSLPWRLAWRSQGVVPWGTLAFGLRKVMQCLPGADGGAGFGNADMPGWRVTLLAELNTPSPFAELSLELVETRHAEAFTATAAVLYQGRLGPLPLDIAQAGLKIRIPLDGVGAIQAEGQAVATSAWERIGAQDLLPQFADTLCRFELAPSPEGGLPMLRLVIAGDLPAIRLPLPGRRPIDLLKPDRFELDLGPTLRLRARLTAPAGESLARTLHRTLGLPNQCSALMDALAGTRATLEVRLPGLSSAQDSRHPTPGFRIELDAPDAPWLDLFETFTGRGAASTAAPTRTEAPRNGRLVQHSATHKIQSPPGGGPLAIRPGRLTVAVGLPATGPELHLSVTIQVRVLGETFDAGLFLDLEAQQPSLRLAAGVNDPITLRIPAPLPGRVNAEPMVADILADLYPGSPSAQRRAEARAIVDQWNQLFALNIADGDQPLMVFELRNVQLRFGLGQNGVEVGASGAVQIIQLPPIVDAVMPLPGPRAVLGATATSVYIEIQSPLAGDEAQVKPLFSIPLAPAGTTGINGDRLPSDQALDLYFGGFTFGYSWAPSSIQVAVKAGVGIPQLLLDVADLSPIAVRVPRGEPGIPSAWVDVEVLQPTAAAPPIPKVNIKFGDTGRPHSQNRGFEQVLQIPHVPDPNRPLGPPLVRQMDLVVEYGREFSIIPITPLLLPGIVLDWGLQVGPSEVTDPAGKVTPVDPLLRLQFRQMQFYLLPAPLIVLFPWSLAPGLLQPFPPYSLVGVLGLFPLLAIPAIDVYTGAPLPQPDGSRDQAVQLLARIPGVIRIEAGLSRPQPSLPIPALLELAMLGQRILAGDVADLTLREGSPIHDISYLEAEFEVDLPFLDFFDPSLRKRGPAGQPPAFPIKVQQRVGLGDVLGGLLPVIKPVFQAVADTRQAAADAGAAAAAAAGSAIKRGQDAVDATLKALKTQLLNLDRRQADLVRMVPIRARRLHHHTAVGFALPGLVGVSFDCRFALCLLTPEELQDELRLYHEGLRPATRRISDPSLPAAGGTPAPAPLPPPVLALPVDLGGWFTAVLHDNTPSAALRNKAQGRLKSAGSAAKAQGAAINQSLAALRRITPDKPGLRQAWLRTLGVPKDGGAKAVRLWATGGTTFPETDLRDLLTAEIAARNSLQTKLEFSFIRHADALAADWANDAIQFVAPTAVPTARAVLTPTPAVPLALTPSLPAAATLLAGRIQLGNLTLLKNKIGTALGSSVTLRPQLAERVAARAQLAVTDTATSADLDRIKAGLIDDFKRLIQEDALVGQKVQLRATDAPAATLEMVCGLAGSAWTSRVAARSNLRSVAHLDLRLVGPRLGGALKPPSVTSAPPAGSGPRRKSLGFALRCRGLDGTLLPESTFMQPVSQASPLYDVVLRNGDYLLRLFAPPASAPGPVPSPSGPAGTTAAAQQLRKEFKLPATVTGLEPDLPGKARRLRARLLVQERFSITPAKPPLSPRLEYGKDFHRSSLFWTAGDPALGHGSPAPSPLFELAAPPNASAPALPGSHGRLNLADLLVAEHQPGKAPTYLTTDRPALLAGLDITLMTALGGSGTGLAQNFVARFRGLVMPDDAHSPLASALGATLPPLPAPPAMFLSARIDHTLSFGSAGSIALNGEMRFVSGDVWNRSNLGTADDGLGFTPGMRFRGQVTLKAGAATIVGDATGRFDKNGLSLTVNVHLHIPKTTLSAADLAGSLTGTLLGASAFPNLAEATFEANGQASLDLRISPAAFSFTATASDLEGHLTVHSELVERIPELVSTTCDWALDLFDSAKDFVEAVVERAIAVARALLGDPDKSTVDKVEISVFGVVIGEFKKVCESVVETVEQTLPSSVNFDFPGSGAQSSKASASITLSSSTLLPNIQLKVHNTKPGEVQKSFTWGFDGVSSLPDWFGA